MFTWDKVTNYCNNHIWSRNNPKAIKRKTCSKAVFCDCLGRNTKWLSTCKVSRQLNPLNAVSFLGVLQTVLENNE